MVEWLWSVVLIKTFLFKVSSIKYIKNPYFLIKNKVKSQHYLKIIVLESSLKIAGVNKLRNINQQFDMKRLQKERKSKIK